MARKKGTHRSNHSAGARRSRRFASYSAGELFMAALGAAILILILALVVTAVAGG